MYLTFGFGNGGMLFKDVNALWNMFPFESTKLFSWFLCCQFIIEIIISTKTWSMILNFYLEEEMKSLPDGVYHIRIGENVG